MIKDLKVFKKSLAIGALVLIASTTGCGKKEKNNQTEISQTQESKTQKNYDTIYYTMYDENAQEFYWEKITERQYLNIDDSLIAEEGENKKDNQDILYVASYQAMGYESAKKYETKSDAIKYNPDYKNNEQYLKGFELGKQDKYIKKAEREQKQYVAIGDLKNPTYNMAETYYYPTEELTVVSYDGANAIVQNYNTADVQAGNYKDLLGKDMSGYTGHQFIATTLKNFAYENGDLIPDYIYLESGNYKEIPLITKDTFPVENKLTNQKTR